MTTKNTHDYNITILQMFSLQRISADCLTNHIPNTCNFYNDVIVNIPFLF